MITDKKVKMTLAEIDAVLKDAKSGDYDNLVYTLDRYCTN